MRVEQNAQQALQIPKDKISSAGEIKGVQNGVVHVKNVGGDQWLLAIDKDAEEVVLASSSARHPPCGAQQRAGRGLGDFVDRLGLLPSQ